MDAKEKHHEKGERKDSGKSYFEKSFENQGGPKEDIRLIVRITGIDLDGRKPIERALTRIKGIGIRMAKNIAIAFEKSSGISPMRGTGTLSEEESKKLEEVV